MLSTPFKTLLKKEVMRFVKVWGQTVITPVLTSFLFLLIFGYSLGSQIKMAAGFTYVEFIVPGLIMMGIINNSFQNTASSILISKYHGNIHDILVAPISYFDTMLAYTLGGVIRGIIVGFITYGVSLCFTVINIHSFFITFSASFLTAIIFAQIGIISAVWSKGFEQLSMITNYVLMPLTYLSGVFYSINKLPEFWKFISQFNPLLYMVNAFRYGMLGITDMNLYLCFSITIIFMIILNLITYYLLRTGYGLRN